MMAFFLYDLCMYVDLIDRSDDKARTSVFQKAFRSLKNDAAGWEQGEVKSLKMLTDADNSKRSKCLHISFFDPHIIEEER